MSHKHRHSHHSLSIQNVSDQSMTLLSHININIYINSLLKIKRKVYDISAISRRLFLAKCDLNIKEQTLFISGCIVETYECAVINHRQKYAMCGDLLLMMSYIPFTYSVKIDYTTLPKLSHRKKIISLIDKNHKHTHHRHRRTFYEVDYYRITELYLDKIYPPQKSKPAEFESFNMIDELLYTSFQINLLQKNK